MTVEEKTKKKTCKKPTSKFKPKQSNPDEPTIVYLNKTKVYDKKGKEYVIFVDGEDNNEISTFNDIKLKIISDANANFEFCPNGSIQDDFFKESLYNCDCVFINRCFNNYRGIAFVTLKDNNGEKYFYIDLICNGRNIIGRTRKETTKTIDVRNCKSGKDLLKKIEEIGVVKSLQRIELSAIDTVISYYMKNGYNFVKNPLNEADFQNMLERFQNLENSDAIIREVYENHFTMPEAYTEDQIAELESNNNKSKAYIKFYGVKMSKSLSKVDLDDITFTGAGRTKRKHKKNKNKTKKKKRKR